MVAEGRDHALHEGSVAGGVVKDKPYSASSITESAQMLADGNRIVNRNEAKTYRDSQGRTRREQTLGERQARAGGVGRHGRVDHVGAGEHVAGDAEVVVHPMPAPVDAVLAGVGGGASACADDVELTLRATVVGVAAFLGAGYRVPLAGVMFVAEATGHPGFVVPGLLAAVAAELVMGRSSVTAYQEVGPHSLTAAPEPPEPPSQSEGARSG